MAKESRVPDQRLITCRVGNHRVPANKIAVHYEQGYGLCGECILRKCSKVAQYWADSGRGEQIEQL